MQAEPTPPSPAQPAPATTPPGRARDRMLAAWLWQGYIRQFLPLLGLATVLMAIDGAMMGALSLLVQPMFDDVLVQGKSDSLIWVALAVAGTFLIRGVTSMIHKPLMTYLAESVVGRMQERLVAHLMRLDQAFYHRHPPGTLIDRVRGDSQGLGVIFTEILPALARDVISIVVLLGVAIWIDWLWTLIAVIGTPLLILPILALQRVVRRVGTRAREASAESSNRLDEVFHGVYTIQRNGLEAREGARFHAAVARFIAASVRTRIGQAGMGALADVVAALGFALVLIYGGGQIIDGTRSVGEFMSFFTAFALMFEPLRRLSGLTGLWQAVLASLDRVHALLQTPATITQPSPPLAPLPGPGQTSIRFEEVQFAYEQDPVLRDFAFTAQDGQTTALVGPSGAGKSTVFTLLTRLADPQSGRITLGGHDIRQMDLAGLRGLFSVVAQDSALFDETLRDNIVLGAAVSEAKLREALEAAHVDEFLAQLPQGLDTRVGPRGSALSGGQRQRVAIARALLRNAPILLLDEATSALDARSEALVQAALDRLSNGRTTLVIAHRLSTVRRADKIVVMDKGRLVEEGDHDALLARGGVYASLHALQFQGSKPA
ncbi:ABC transporter ATP-binding protein [Pararhodobacter sp.]|uniref:ABC transporter ATP-binding protein n=1 Tax=Pararhodobacter sp. TaxID=2127056 RepID=UPI002FDCA63F